MYPNETTELSSADVGVTGVLLYAFLPDANLKIEFSKMTWIEENCIMAKVPPPVQRKDTLIMPFHTTVWILIFISMIISIVFLCGNDIALAANASNVQYFCKLFSISFRLHIFH